MRPIKNITTTTSAHSISCKETTRIFFYFVSVKTISKVIRLQNWRSPQHGFWWPSDLHVNLRCGKCIGRPKIFADRFAKTIRAPIQLILRSTSLITILYISSFSITSNWRYNLPGNSPELQNENLVFLFLSFLTEYFI